MPRHRDVWTDEKRKLFEEGFELYGRSSKDIAAHIGDGMTKEQVNNYKQAHKKRQEKAAAAAAAAAKATASTVQPATLPQPRAREAPPVAPEREETLRPPPSATREDQDGEDQDGVEEFKEETPAETSAAQAREETPHEEDHDVEVRQDASLVATSDAAQPSQSEDSVTFVLAVMNTKDGGNVRTPSANPGITQTAGPLFQQVMSSFKRYIINAEGFGSVPAAWLVTEVAWALGNGFMSALSQRAPDGARSTLVKEAAVVWGARYGEGAEALTLRLLGIRNTERHYVQVAGKSLRVDTQKSFKADNHFKAGQFEEMLSRVAAARLTLAPVGQCLLLSYHGLHIIRGPGSDEEKFRRKCRYLRWLLLLARLLSDLLGIPVILGGDLNLDVSKLEVKDVLGDATEDAELVKYEVNPRRKKNVVDWFYLINPCDGLTRLVCDRCEAIDPAKPYRDDFAAEEQFTLHEKFFDHDALLAVLRFVIF